MSPLVMHLASASAVTFVSSSEVTYNGSTEATTHTISYTPTQTGRLFIAFAADNVAATLGSAPTGWTAHVLDQAAGSTYTLNLSVLSIEVTDVMVDVAQSWDFIIAFSKRATAVLFMLDNVDHSDVAGGSYADSTATDRTSAGGGTVTVGANSSAVVAFAASNNASGSLSVNETASFTQDALVNPGTTFQPNAYGGHLLNATAGTVTVPSFANSSSMGMSVFAMEVQAA